MNLNISISRRWVSEWKQRLEKLPLEKFIVPLAILFATVATYLSYINDKIISYGDAESHLNIAKRVIDSLTAGMAQLGGIWLPIPHLLMVPFVYFDGLWRTGLAGSIVSGLAYVVSGIFVYKTFYYLTKNKLDALS